MDTATRSNRLLALTSTLILMLVATPCLAQVYKSVDKKGKVTFTDKPTDNAAPVELREPNTSQAVSIPDKVAPTSEELAETGYTAVSITSPQNDGIIPNGLVGFTVETQISPALNGKHRLQLSIDGTLHSTGTGTFKVDSISRGQHQLQVSIVDDEGNIQKQSATVNIFVYRPS